jgi:4-hydroxybenzoate polyprenyltransferase
MPKGLFWFLAASFCNGIVIELGRKIRAPAQEEQGVETYSFLWGRRNAVLSWLAALAATAACALVAAQRISFAFPVACVLGGFWLLAITLGVAFLHTESGRLAKSIEAFSAIWTVLLYLTLGVVPLWVSLS